MSNLLKKVIGVDVGAKFLTVSFNDHRNQDQVHNIENNQRSILAFLKKISTEDYCFVIEATGNYSSRLLHLSLSKCFESSLINCMSVKHFSRMKNIITKTDAEDAKLIRLYGEMFRPEIYIPKSIEIEHLECRTSKTHIRGMLYVCSWTAMKHNAPCKELYLRLLAKGKPKKVALIAVCNKLLRICFSVVKNKTAYRQDYQKNLKILT